VIFFLPHQDDEMFLAGSISRFIQEGRVVHAVMASDGGASSVRAMLNGRDERGQPAFCLYHGRFHSPEREGYAPLDGREFSAARNREFKDSMLKLGVLPQNIHFANPGGAAGSDYPRYRDGRLTAELSAEIIGRFYRLFGDGTYITLGSRKGESQHLNPDHLALGEALRHLSGITDKRFYTDKEKPAAPSFLSAREQASKYQALLSYSVWEPGQGRFAIGAHSVKYLLDEWENKPVEYAIQLDIASQNE